MAAHDARAIISFGLYDNTNGWVIPAADPGRENKWSGILTYGLLLAAAAPGAATPYYYMYLTRLWGEA